MMLKMTGLGALSIVLAGCCPCDSRPSGSCVPPAVSRVEALADSVWAAAKWISVPGTPTKTEQEGWKVQRSVDGVSWFVSEPVNAADVKRAVWMTTGLGVYEIFVNGTRVGTDALKPGYTHYQKTRRSFTYDVTSLMKTAKGAKNVLSAEVSAGWWRDQIVVFRGQRSAFRGVLQLTYADGTTKILGTDPENWRAGVGGPVTHAGIFDGEEYDARVATPSFADLKAPVENTEFKGQILPSEGGEVCRRCDLAMTPVEAYAWKGVTGAAKDVFGKVVRTKEFAADGELRVLPGETLVVDFGQNAAAVPVFEFRAAKGTVLTCLPGEMLNDANGERARGNDGPGGSIYRENLRIPDQGMRIVYTFASDAAETYMPRHTFFGYRYVSITATAPVTITRLRSVPVTSIAKDLELGRIETGDKALNRFISNVYWGQLSNYLSVPTDCPQRNERLGWMADTQVFTEAGAYNANTAAFFRKWTRDVRDNQLEDGSFPSVAPFGQYGNWGHRLGWSDAGVIVPWTVWRMFGDTAIVRENWEAMERFLATQEKTKYASLGNWQYGDWLSFEEYESCTGRAKEKGPDGQERIKPDAVRYWDFMAACYWHYDARLMSEMAAAIGRAADAERYAKMSARAMDHIRATFIDPKDGLLIAPFRPLQGAAVFALRFGVLTDAKAIAATKAALVKNIKEHDGCLQTGFLGTSFIMDALSENGLVDEAYSLLLNHNHPGWLYSVDQGATTIWERWNSYTKDKGFGPVGMNSFNHYAYGSVLAWIYRNAAGIASTSTAPGFKRIVMAPKPDRRLGYVKAEYASAAGPIKSAWRYEGEKWIWNFTVPAGAVAAVTLPGETVAKDYAAGTYEIVK